VRAVGAVGVLAVGSAGCVRAVPVDPVRLGGLALTSTVIAADGTVLAHLHAEQDRRPVTLAQLPPVLVQGVLAAEDRRFYSHSGVDAGGVARAGAVDAGTGSTRQGGSTLTQQLVKNTLVTPEHSVRRKVREAALAMGLERSLTKDQILERYLNTVYFGQGTYGVGAAARAYFGHGPEKMTAAEAALLAGLIRSPSAADPVMHPNAAHARRTEVLQAMTETGALTAEQARAAGDEALPTQLHKDDERYLAPYALTDAIDTLLGDPRLGPDRATRESAIFRGGLTIRLTIDPRQQAAAEQAVAGVLDQPSDPDAAVAAVTPGSGGITALVGGRDFYSTTSPTAKVDLARGGTTKRQAGSTFKAFTLITALEHGIRPDDEFLAGAQTTIDRGRNPVWDVTNYEGTAYGSVTVRDATEQSINTAYAHIVQRLGNGDVDAGAALVVDTAQRLGVRGAGEQPLRRDPATTLGSGEVDPVEMAAAYATLASGGVYAAPYLVASVTDSSGGLLEQAQPQPRQVVAPGVAAVANDLLAGVVREGTGVRARLPRPEAGKTGTTSAYRDAWYVGYTPNFAAAVWLGVATGAVSMVPENGFRTVIAGGTLPTEIWRRFASSALLGVDAPDFADPGDAVIRVDVDATRGCRPNAWTPTAVVAHRTYLRGTEPTAVCTSPTGPAATVVPAVLGVAADAATGTLDAAGFTVAVRTSYDATYPAGTVVGQEPSSGAAVDAGSTVTITVAARSGVDATVPDLLGSDRAGAEQALAMVGLRAAVEVVPSCADGAGCPVTLARDRGRVWRQDVPADATLPVGSTVGLGVGP